MSFAPDIVAIAPDSTELLLIVEAKLFPLSLKETESGLKRYMVHTNSPVGLLVSPDSLSIYRNEFKEDAESSVMVVGRYPNDLTEFAMLKPNGWRRGEDFEVFVHSWLEDLARTREVHTTSKELKKAITTHILPALLNGDIRAAGPRQP